MCVCVESGAQKGGGEERVEKEEAGISLMRGQEHLLCFSCAPRPGPATAICGAELVLDSELVWI